MSGEDTRPHHRNCNYSYSVEGCTCDAWFAYDEITQLDEEDKQTYEYWWGEP